MAHYDELADYILVRHLVKLSGKPIANSNFSDRTMDMIRIKRMIHMLGINQSIAAKMAGVPIAVVSHYLTRNNDNPHVIIGGKIVLKRLEDEYTKFYADIE